MKINRVFRDKFFKNKYLKYTLLLFLGLFLGWVFFHPSENNERNHKNSTTIEQDTLAQKSTIWTCAMHPQIRMDHPGNCPICGMELIPLGQSNSSSQDPDAIHMTNDAAQLANVMTSVVSKQKPVKEVRLFGKVQADERSFQNQVAHVPGRIENLTVNFTGETVKKGQVLAEIYSPELVTAQQELLETIKTKQVQPELYEASKEKLRLWKLSDDQINAIESSGTIINNFKVLSNTTGTVIARRVNTGDHVSEGTVLYEIADLSKVWVLFDAYESDLQFLREGKKINYTLQAFPGTEFSGKIAFIDPVIDPVNRVAKVRVEVPNKSEKLKPEMFASGIVSSDLEEYHNNIVIPRSAVLWTGKRSIVYVKQPGTGEPVFKMREIELGPALGDSYVVITGLREGEEIVTSGTFSVDASAQLEGKPSMMNQGGGKISSMPGMDMPDAGKLNNKEESAKTGKIVSKKSDVSMDFVMQLNEVFERYIVLKNALVNSDSDKAGLAAKKVKESLLTVDVKLLTGDAHTKWIDILNNLNKQTDAIVSSSKIEDQRNAFSDLSDELYIAVKIFGLMEKTIYYQFCPMAKDGKGAYWLSEINDIQNPYYGVSMIACGETREVLKF